jgi:hypothetical protein
MNAGIERVNSYLAKGESKYIWALVVLGLIGNTVSCVIFTFGKAK